LAAAATGGIETLPLRGVDPALSSPCGDEQAAKASRRAALASAVLDVARKSLLIVVPPLRGEEVMITIIDHRSFLYVVCHRMWRP